MLQTEADVVRALSGCVTLDDVYEACRQAAVIERNAGLEPVAGHGSDQVWKRRARNALQTLRQSGKAKRLRDRTWLLDGPLASATVFLLVGSGAELADVELRIGQALELLEDLEGPVDLVLCDPPYGLGRDGERASSLRLYNRDHRRVVGGYVDVHPDAYREFTTAWVSAAAGVLRPGGQMAVVTGPQRAAHVQLAAEDAGLDWVASIAARREFALYHRRRPAPAHWTVTVMSSGGLYHPQRVFNAPDWQLARSGRAYPLDWWDGNGRSDRPGALRYDNALPPKLADRLVQCFSGAGELVCDPFVGSGEVMLACVRNERRFIGSDLNAQAVRFAAARLLAEERPLQAAAR